MEFEGAETTMEPFLGWQNHFNNAFAVLKGRRSISPGLAQPRLPWVPSADWPNSERVELHWTIVVAQGGLIQLFQSWLTCLKTQGRRRYANPGLSDGPAFQAGRDIMPRSQTPLGNVIAEAIRLPIPLNDGAG